MKLLLDTNVIIDYLSKQAPFFENAELVVTAGYFGDAQLWASVQSFKDALFVLSHYASPESIQAAVSKLLEIVNPIDLTGNNIATAATLQWHDTEDCLVALGAQKAHATYIITRDQKGFERSMVPAISPAEWLAEMQEKH